MKYPPVMRRCMKPADSAHILLGLNGVTEAIAKLAFEHGIAECRTECIISEWMGKAVRCRYLRCLRRAVF
jgi:hypothetical protein